MGCYKVFVANKVFVVSFKFNFIWSSNVLECGLFWAVFSFLFFPQKVFYFLSMGRIRLIYVIKNSNDFVMESNFIQIFYKSLFKGLLCLIKPVKHVYLIKHTVKWNSIMLCYVINYNFSLCVFSCMGLCEWLSIRL